MYFIGLDIGTTGCKAAVFDEAGACFGRCYEEFDIICRAPGWAEQSPAVMWEAVTHVLKESVAQAKAAGMRAEEVRALSTSVLGEEVMPVDGDYRPLRDAILGMDYRADEETKLLTGAVPAQRIYDITGFPPHPMGSLPTILWMRRHEPELIPRTYKYVTFTEYVMKRLGAGEGVVDHPQAGRTMAFDIERKCWSDELLRAAGLDRSLFCETAEPGRVVGNLSREAAAELGLTEAVALVAGGQDQTCAALGAGLIDESIGMDSHGTIEGIGVMSSKKITDERALAAGVSCYAYTIPGRYFLMSSSQVGGLLLKWFKNNFSLAEEQEARRTGRNVYDVMTERAPEGPSGVMVLPHFIGSGPPWNDLDSRGAIVGAHDRQHPARRGEGHHGFAHLRVQDQHALLRGYGLSLQGHPGGGRRVQIAAVDAAQGGHPEPPGLHAAGKGRRLPRRGDDRHVQHGGVPLLRAGRARLREGGPRLPAGSRVDRRLRSRLPEVHAPL